ncbi:MAG: hypothetical protein ACE5EH_10930 [Gammaproteobacteria bacterium]
MPTYTTMLIGKHHSYGSMQEKHGDLLKAEKLYFMELVHSRMGHASAKRIPTALYNLGRVKGYLCKNEEAERYLVTAYDLVNNGPGHSENEKIKYNLELAKFYFENNLFEDAEPYYASLFNRLSTTPNSQDIKALLRQITEQYTTILGEMGKFKQAKSLTDNFYSIGYSDLTELPVNESELRYGSHCNTAGKAANTIAVIH